MYNIGGLYPPSVCELVHCMLQPWTLVVISPETRWDGWNSQYGLYPWHKGNWNTWIELGNIDEIVNTITLATWKYDHVNKINKTYYMDEIGHIIAINRMKFFWWNW
jgi:hypothetical protein